MTFAKQLISHIPVVGELAASYTVAQEQATKSYHDMKNNTITAINTLNERINNPSSGPIGFGKQTKDELCYNIQFTDGVLSLIDQGQTLPASDEGPNSDEYKKFKTLVSNAKVICNIKGGNFYKLKIKSKNKTKKTRNSKKYKGKKLFKKSKRLAK